MTTERTERHPVDELAEDFLARYRRGELPAVSEYARRYPELADQVQEVLQALVLMEQLKPGEGGPAAGAAAGGQPLRQVGEYRILREVGRGGMGVVYEAVQESLGRRVALKVLPADALLSPTHRERFRHEARAVARLHHTNIVPDFGVGEEHGVHYFAMQFIHGQPLDEVLQEVRRLGELTGRSRDPTSNPAAPSGSVAEALLSGAPQGTPEGDRPPDPDAGAIQVAPASSATRLTGSELTTRSGDSWHYFTSVARVGLQVAEALAYAHGQGVLHRDIKPSNLLLDTQGKVWVTDFGLAKTDAHENLTYTGDIVGTLRYMAPERFQGWSDPRSDVYGLGLTLYEMLALRPAFEERDRVGLIRQVVHDEPARPRKLDRRIPRDLETVVLKAIAKEAGDRYPSAAELAEDLRCFLADRPIHARRSPARERAWRWCRRNPALAILGAAVVLLLLVAAASATVGYVKTAAALGQSDAHLTLARKAEADEVLQRHLAERERDAAQQHLYAARLLLAQRAWQAGEIGQLQDLLDRERPSDGQEDRRGWEWYYLRGFTSKELLTLRGHAKDVEAVAYRPDGRQLATASWDGTVRVWDAATGQELRTLQGHTAPVLTVAWSLDGKRLASAGEDRTVRVWDADNGQELWTSRGHAGKVRSVAWKPDGKRIASAGEDRTVKVWDADNGQELQTFHSHAGTVVSVAWHPDGGRLASTARERDVTARIWDVATGRELLTVRKQVDELMPSGVAWSPDGRRLASVHIEGQYGSGTLPDKRC